MTCGSPPGRLLPPRISVLSFFVSTLVVSSILMIARSIDPGPSPSDKKAPWDRGSPSSAPPAPHWMLCEQRSFFLALWAIAFAYRASTVGRYLLANSPKFSIPHQAWVASRPLPCRGHECLPSAHRGATVAVTDGWKKRQRLRGAPPCGPAALPPATYCPATGAAWVSSRICRQHLTAARARAAPSDGARPPAQRAQNRRPKHVCFFLF